MANQYTKAIKVEWYVYRKSSPREWARFRGPFETVAEVKSALRRVRAGSMVTPPHHFAVFKVTEEQIVSIK